MAFKWQQFNFGQVITIPVNINIHEYDYGLVINLYELLFLVVFFVSNFRRNIFTLFKMKIPFAW